MGGLFFAILTVFYTLFGIFLYELRVFTFIDELFAFTIAGYGIFQMFVRKVPKNKPFIISCGYDDFYVRCTDLFSEKCRYMGIPHFVLLTPGKHSWPYWGFALEQHIAFFQKLMRGDNLGY